MKLLTILLIALLNGSLVESHSHSHSHPALLRHAQETTHRHEEHTCGTTSPSDTEKAEDALHMKRWDLASLSKNALCDGCVTIDVIFHVFSDGQPRRQNAYWWERSTDELFTNQGIEHQMMILNQQFAGSPFRFNLIETNQILDASLANADSTSDLDEIKSYRSGGGHVANVYWFQGHCEANGNSTHVSMLCGRATFPFNGVREIPQNDYIYMCPLCMSNPASLDDDAASLVHEIGHWLGLYHTVSQRSLHCVQCLTYFMQFEGYSCSGAGDRVDDTPQQSSYTFGECDYQMDSCPNQSGFDPTANYMNYGRDECQSEFSPGQIARMWAQWNEYRAPNDQPVQSPTDQPVRAPTNQPVRAPTNQPVRAPTDQPTHAPNAQSAPEPTGQPIIAPTGQAPTNQPVLSPTQPPVQEEPNPPAPSPSSCFSERNHVVVKGNGRVSMKDVRVGDMVLVAGGKYEALYSFCKRSPEIKGNYLQVFARELQEPLELTGNHLVFISHDSSFGDKTAIKASRLAVGDVLLHTDGPVTVSKIETVQRIGAYAPYTLSGTIIVNGVLASTYATLPEGILSNDSQGLLHFSVSHYRVLCTWFSGMCRSETYSVDEGLSPIAEWSQLIYDVVSNQDYKIVTWYCSATITVGLVIVRGLEFANWWIITLLLAIILRLKTHWQRKVRKHLLG